MTQPEPPPADDRPLFILGCVRSGTTLTRDLLRRAPGFICPEETHFFRWAEPFRTPHSLPPLRGNPTLRHHRDIDGVSEAAFDHILRQSRSKAELQRSYITAFARAQGVNAPYRWFDKTPQNIYGAALIAQELPKARFLFLVRNPLNVVASMIAGRQVRVSDPHGALNYWLEAGNLGRALAAAHPDRVKVLRYEDLVADVPTRLGDVLRFAEVSFASTLYAPSDAHPERDRWREVLSPEVATMILGRARGLAACFGYDLEAAMRAAGQDDAA